MDGAAVRGEPFALSVRGRKGLRRSDGDFSARRAGSSDLSGIWAAFGEGGKPASVRTQCRKG